MRTPAIIDTMNKRCYDIIPPKAKKEITVTYQPLVESNLTYSLLADPSIPLIPITTEYSSFIGGSGDESKIYLPSENPIPLPELETLDSFRAIAPPSFPTGGVPRGLVVNGVQIYTYYQQTVVNVLGNTNVSVDVYFIVIDNGEAYIKTNTIVFDVGFTYTGNILISSTPRSPAIVVIGRYAYVVLDIYVISPSGTIIDSTAIVEIDMQTHDIVSAKLYVGLPLYGMYIDQNGYPVTYNIVGSGSQTNTMYRYRLNNTSLQPVEQLVFTMPTAPLPPPPPPLPPPYFYVSWFNPPYAVVSVPRTTISVICSVLSDKLECYQGMQKIEYGGTTRIDPILTPFIYMGDTVVYVTPYIGTTTTTYYMSSIVLGGKPYGYYYPTSQTDPRNYPQAVIHSVGGDLYIYDSMNVYVHMAEPIPWTKCCDIETIGATCLYSPPYPFPSSVSIYVEKINVPFTYGSKSPQPPQPILPSSIKSSVQSFTNIVSKDVVVNHIC